MAGGTEGKREKKNLKTRGRVGAEKKESKKKGRGVNLKIWGKFARDG